MTEHWNESNSHNIGPYLQAGTMTFDLHTQPCSKTKLPLGRNSFYSFMPAYFSTCRHGVRDDSKRVTVKSQHTCARSSPSTNRSGGRSGIGGKARKDEGCDVVESRGMVSLNLSAVLPKPIKFISGSSSKILGISSLLAM